MRKLIISLLLILMFAFSLSKNNPIKKRAKTVKINEPQLYKVNIRCRCIPCDCQGVPPEDSVMKLSRETRPKHIKYNKYKA